MQVAGLQNTHDEETPRDSGWITHLRLLKPSLSGPESEESASYFNSLYAGEAVTRQGVRWLSSCG
jgi:hypothetical protein